MAPVVVVYDPTAGSGNWVSALFGKPYPFDLRAVVDVVNGRFEITHLEVEQASPRTPSIGRGWLALMPTEGLIRTAFDYSTLLVHDGSAWHSHNAEIYLSEQYLELDALRSPTESLSTLSKVYRLLRLTEPNPTTLISRHFDVNDATVRRWLMKAVDAGHLSQEERGR